MLFILTGQRRSWKWYTACVKRRSYRDTDGASVRRNIQSKKSCSADRHRDTRRQQRTENKTNSEQQGRSGVDSGGMLPLPKKSVKTQNRTRGVEREYAIMAARYEGMRAASAPNQRRRLFQERYRRRPAQAREERLKRSMFRYRIWNGAWPDKTGANNANGNACFRVLPRRRSPVGITQNLQKQQQRTPSTNAVCRVRFATVSLSSSCMRRPTVHAPGGGMQETKSSPPLSRPLSMPPRLYPPVYARHTGTATPPRRETVPPSFAPAAVAPSHSI